MPEGTTVGGDSRIVVTSARVIAPGLPQEPVDLLLADGRVADVGPSSSIRLDGVTTVDAAGCFVIPGLVDAHVHLILDAEPDIVAYVERCSEDDYRRTALRNANQALRSGVTTMRDLGCCHHVATALGHRLRTDGSGPRIAGSGHMLAAADSHVRRIPRTVSEQPGDAERAVVEQIAGGAEWVKVIASGGLLTPGTEPGKVEGPDGLVRRVAAAAHRHGRPLAVHTYTDAAATEAMSVAVASIEHGTWLSDPVLDAMAEQGVALVPTLCAPRAILDNADALPAHVRDNAERTWEGAAALIARAHRSGTSIVAGTDAGTPFNPHGRVAAEVQLLSHCGLPSEVALAAATTTAEQLFAGGPTRSPLSVGSRADAVVLGSDPRRDLQALHDVRAVIAAGRLVERPAASEA